MVVSDQGQLAKTLANLGDPVELSGYIRINDWNRYEVIANISFRNLWLKTL